MPRAAIALLLLGAPLAARTPAEGEDQDWLALDREVAGLHRAVEEEQAGPELSIYLKISYRNSDDPAYSNDPITFADIGNLSGFDIDSMAIVFKGDVGDYEYKISYNPESQKLRSTYVRFRPVEPVRLTMGKFKAPLLRSRLLTTTRLLFLDRTIQARETGPRDLGFKAEVELAERAKLYAAAQNGDDDQAKELLWTGRLNVDVFGGGVSKYEGAYKAGDEPRLTFGLGAQDDTALGDGLVLAADAAFSLGRFSLGGEIVRHGDDYGNYRDEILDPATILQRGGTTAWDATASWMLIEKKLEVAVRHEEFDDPNDVSRLTAGLNYYLKGHKAKLQLNWIDVSNDLPLLESEVIALGFVLDG